MSDPDEVVWRRRGAGLVSVQFETRGKAYVYRSGGLSLEVGDKVIVPPSWWNPVPQVATVAQIDAETSYTGELKTITGMAY